MQKNKYAVIAGAALAAVLPLSAKAVTIGYTFDPTVTLLDLNGNSLGLAPVVNVGGNLTVTVPQGDFLQVTVDGSVSGNANTAPASGTNVVPVNLGLASFQIGATSSNKSIAVVENSGYWSGVADTNTTTGAANANFATSAAGVLDGNGGISTGTGVFGGNTPNNTGSAAGAAQDSYAAGTTATNLFGPLYIGSTDNPFTAAGTSTFTLTGAAANQAYYTYKSGGGTGKGATAPVYQNTAPTASDTITLGTLTVVVASTVTSTTSATTTANKIISLTSTAPTTYGSQLGHSITITGKNGSYTTGNTGQVADPGFTTAFTAVGTFSPAGDTEVYALKLDKSGVAIATTNTTLIAAIINDINASNTGGITASTVTGAYANLFPGYDVLLTAATGPSATPYLGVDFSGDTADTGVTVTEIAAVPEPATAAGVVLGAAGLLLGRRKSRVTIA